jgi:hypothetical protein
VSDRQLPLLVGDSLDLSGTSLEEGDKHGNYINWGSCGAIFVTTVIVFFIEIWCNCGD